VYSDVQFIDVRHGWIAGLAGYVLRTVDGGTTWSKSWLGAGVNVQGIAFADTQHGVACGYWWVPGPWEEGGGDIGDYGAILFSTSDGGKTWRGVKVLSDVIGGMSKVSAVDASTFFGAGCVSQVQYYSDVLGTVDGGASWQVLRNMSGHTAATLYDVDFVSASKGWVCGYSGNSGRGVILSSNDGGASWKKQPTPACGLIMGISFVDTRHGWACAPQSVLRTTDAGATWTKTTVLSDPDIGFQAIYFLDARHGWAVGNEGTIMATTDGGDTWTAQSTGTKGDMMAVSFTSAKVGWVVSDRSAAFKTTDGGATWVRVR
jgi:photosystem II stability/assembly factor-like uncharacterized protein